MLACQGLGPMYDRQVIIHMTNAWRRPGCAFYFVALEKRTH